MRHVAMPCLRAGREPLAVPILVMELVEGATLERRIETGSLDLERGLHLLDGIAAGLHTLHAAGLGHLDLKPSNVILRDPDGPGPGLETAVLVDFGLAGRTVRPGCATASYGAPEVWGLVPAGHVPQPAPADVYAFACVAFESLTGKTLFDGPSDLAVVGAHLQHDGELPALASLAHHDRRLTPLVQALAEAIHFGTRAGLDVERVLDVIGKGAAQSWQMDNRGKTMVADKFDFGFAVDWMRKDLGLVIDEAKHNGARLPVTALVDQFYSDVQAMGGRRWDTSSLIKRLK
jgi:serine/threonine protein kinase